MEAPNNRDLPPGVTGGGACRLQLDTIRAAVLDHVIPPARIIKGPHHTLGPNLFPVVGLLLRGQLSEGYAGRAPMRDPPNARKQQRRKDQGAGCRRPAGRAIKRECFANLLEPLRRDGDCRNEALTLTVPVVRC